MNATLAVAVGMVRTWVALYTFGLTKDLRSARRWEIDSDVWEQQQLAEIQGESAISTAVEMVVRTLLGVISDITWRAQAGLSTRPDRSIKVNDSLTMRGFFLAAIAIAVVPAVLGTMVLAGGGDPGSTAMRVILGSVSLFAGVTMAAGLVLSTRKPRLGIALVAVGAISIAVAWFWMPFITIPIGVAFIYLAYRRARNTGWPSGAGTA